MNATAGPRLVFNSNAGGPPRVITFVGETRDTRKANQGQRMRTLLLACGLLLVVVGVGVFIGLKASPPAPGERTGSLPPSDEPQGTDGPQTVEEKTIPAAEPKPRLNLPGVAVVDLARLVAAHPRTARLKESFAEGLSEAQSFSDSQTRAAMKRMLEAQRDESRKRVTADVQKIIAGYAATNDFSLVLDRSASPRPDRPIVEYSSNKVEFIDVTTASGVKDITQAILQLLASEPPNNGLHWTRR